MIDFDSIFGMDWLHACFASIDCRTRVVKFNFPNESVIEWKGGNSIPRGRIISCMKAYKMISKGCSYHIVRVQDLESKIPPIESVPVVREFTKVFPNNLPGIPLEREIYFGQLVTEYESHFNSSLSDGSGRIERVKGST